MTVYWTDALSIREGDGDERSSLGWESWRTGELGYSRPFPRIKYGKAGSPGWAITI
jgi:hypothetical protein